MEFDENHLPNYMTMSNAVIPEVAESEGSSVIGANSRFGSAYREN